MVLVAAESVLGLASAAALGPDSFPQTCLLLLTRSYRPSLASAEDWVTLTGAKPEVLSICAPDVFLAVLASLERLNMGCSCL